MGTFEVTFTVAPIEQRRRTMQVTAMVDTGATYTMLPASSLAALGIQPETVSQFELADGRLSEPASYFRAWPAKVKVGI